MTREFIQMCEHTHTVSFCNHIKQEIIKSKCQHEAWNVYTVLKDNKM